MGIAGEHIVLQAEELGLATCWMGWIGYRRVRKALGVPRNFKIVAMMPLGYAEKRPAREPPRQDPRGDRLLQPGAGRVRGRRMFVFLLIALTVYGLANFYVGRRGAQALASDARARAVFLVLFIGLALAFPLGRSLMVVARGRLTSALVEAGTFHLAVMLYGLHGRPGRRPGPPGQRVRPVPAEDLVRGGREAGPAVFAVGRCGGRPDARLRRLERDPPADGRSRAPHAAREAGTGRSI
ncbi:MAG: nitroreductase family protein [Candidatus Moduliflexus flocculans]|nr:nitroreductase family protein [Candidatus Moduliflexus flocculans]